MAAAKRLVIATSAGVLALMGVAVAPAFGAPEAAGRRPAPRRPATALAALGSFTPAAADPRLAAMFARSGLADDGFNFTPAQSRRSARAVTVAVRARTTHALAAGADRPAATVGLAPVAYNLGAAIGWKRFAVLGDLAHVELAGQPGSREAADVGVAYTLNRFTGRLRGGVDRPIGDLPRLIEQAPSYSVDLGGAYRLTRNVDLTAGLRYRVDREQLQQTDDQQRRDSQAVYVGTAFRF